MTPQQALQFLDGITDPRNAGKLTRLDYVNTQLALETLAKIVNSLPIAAPEPDPLKATPL